jgi:hypothetical protein
MFCDDVRDNVSYFCHWRIYSKAYRHTNPWQNFDIYYTVTPQNTDISDLNVNWVRLEKNKTNYFQMSLWFILGVL